jgi:two-component system CheB/CheR fusion protein
MHKYTLLVLVFSLAVTIGLWQIVLHDNEEILRTSFHNRVTLIENKIQEAVADNEKLLLGCSGLFASTPQVTRRIWREYVAKLDMERTFPGIQGLGFGKRVIFSELASHIRNVRAEGFASYTVKPAGDRKEYVPVLYLEPFRDRNLRAFGYDMFSEPLRRAAMERARDEGRTIISGLITLVQETPGKSSVQLGFLMFRPIYSADVSSATIDDRRRTLLGYAYIPVRFGDFFNRITHDNAYWTGISVYDGEEADPARLAYTSTNTAKSEKFSASYVPTFVETVKLTVYGRVWTVKYFSLPSFDTANKTLTPWYLLGLGFLASVFLSAMTYFIEKRSQAEMISKQEKEVIMKREELQRVSSAYARSLLEASLDPLVTISAQGKIMDVNEASVQATGVAREHLIGCDFSDFFTEPDKARAGYQEVFSEGFVRDYPLAIRHTTGRIIDVLYNASLYKDDKGNVLGVFAAARDITKRKEIEAGLEKTRKELAVIKIVADEVSEFAESIINTVREPLIALDQDLRIVKVSRSFCEFFKVNTEETVGQLIYDLGNKQWDIPKLQELLETILPQKTTFDNYEVEHDFATIGRRVMLLNARQIQRVSGKERIILLAIEDITEKKKFEREVLTAKNIAEVASRVKSDFLANMSHELRTPLNSIIGFSEVLEDELLGALNPSQREDVQYILKAGRHLLSLINDILDLAKVESGKIQLEVELLSLKEMLESMLAMHREKASRHGISIDLQMETVADITIEVDERKLKQILFNLLSNAVKFTPDGGAVRVMAIMLPGAKEIEISVEDTGIGIKQEDIQKLFKEFSQLESTYDKEYGGTGLGLALTKKLVELQGGRIWVTSEFGKGSRFAFVLPVRQER